MPIRAGAIADGDDFFDRKIELEDFWRYIEGNHIVLTGPRRLGKSSLLKRFSEEAAGHGILAKLIDVEGIDSAAEFVTVIERAFPDESIRGYATNAGAAVGGLLSRFRKVDIKLPGGVGGGLEL